MLGQAHLLPRGWCQAETILQGDDLAFELLQVAQQWIQSHAAFRAVDQAPRLGHRQIPLRNAPLEIIMILACTPLRTRWWLGPQGYKGTLPLVVQHKQSAQRG